MTKLFLFIALFHTSLLHAWLKTNHIEINTVSRDYYVHFPNNYNKNKASAVLFYLHGGGENIKKMARSSSLNNLADLHHFIVVYPVGIDKHWQDGRKQTYSGTNKTHINDVAFIDKLIETFKSKYKIDKKKIYVTGVSNGGLMTLRLGCELSHKLSAVAPVIANMPKNYLSKCRPKKTLPLLLMNGTKDPIVPYNGGEMKFLKKRMGEVTSTKETIGFWIKHNQCNKNPNTKNLPNLNKRDNSYVIKQSYTKCKNDATVELYSIQGGGHSMPSKRGFNLAKLLGERNRDIEGINVIVDFLLKY
jgi:polyhydroxybutyrate depolymerase